MRFWLEAVEQARSWSLVAGGDDSVNDREAEEAGSPGLIRLLES
jgi:hypothetical protein